MLMLVLILKNILKEYLGKIFITFDKVLKESLLIELIFHLLINFLNIDN